MYWNIALIAIALVAMLYYYGQNLMSGGDVKILTLALLWIGPVGAPIFETLLLVFIGARAGLARIGWINVQKTTYSTCALDRLGHHWHCRPGLAAVDGVCLDFDYPQE